MANDTLSASNIGPISVTDNMTPITSAHERIGYSYTGFNEMIRYFNLSKLPDYDNAPEPYLAYILMSKPMLNIASNKSYTTVSDENARANLTAMQNNAMTAAFTNDSYGHSMLMGLSAYPEYKTMWLPNITTKAMSYTVGDVELKTVEKGNTYYGHSIKYAKHSEDHKVSGSISIDFRNDRYLSILKQMYLWWCYMYIISKDGSVQPRLDFQRNAILDYPASLYFLVTRRDGRELVYWEKLVGVFPTRVPMSMFSYNDGMILEDKLSIDFSYGIKADPCDPSILMDINYLSGDTYHSIVRKSVGSASHDYRNVPSNVTTGHHGLNFEKELNNNEAPFVKGDVYARNPYVQFVKGSDGRIHYYLRWEGESVRPATYL